MPKPWEQFASPAAQSGPWDKFQTTPAPGAPGSPEAIAAIESVPGTAARELGVAARPWGPLGAAMATGGAIGLPFGAPGGIPGMLATGGIGAGAGATAYAAAHLADLPVMAVNGLGALFGHNPEFTGPGAAFDNFVNQYNPLPQPESKGEEYLAAISGGVKDAVAGNRAGLTLKAFEAPQALRPVFQGMTPTVQKVGTALSDAPVQNTALGGLSEAGAQFGGDVTNDSTGGKIAGAALPVLSVVAGRGLVRGTVNATGGPSGWKAFRDGTLGRGEDIALENGEVIPKSWFGGRQEVARQLAENQVQSEVLSELLAGRPNLTRDEVISEALSNLDKDNVSGAGIPMREGWQPGYQATSGALMGNPGGLAIENGLFQNSTAMRARYQNNWDAVSRSVADATTQSGAPIEESQGFISRLLGNAAKRSEQRAKQFEDIDMSRANDLVASKKADVTSSATADQQAAASQAARRTANDMMVNEKAAYRKLYAAVPRETPITFENSLKAGEEALAEHGVNAGVAPSIASARQRIGAMMKDRAANPETTFGELESDIKIVNEFISEAERAGQNQAVRLYVMFKDGLIADREAGGTASTALRQANDSFKAFQNRWANGPAGEAMDKATLPSETMGKYMSSPEGAGQYSKTVGTTPTGKQAAGDYLASSVAKGAGANPTKQSVMAAINKNPAISTFPEVKAAEEAKAAQIGEAIDAQSKTAARLTKKQSIAEARKKVATDSLPGKYSQGSSDSAVSAVGTAFSSKDPTSAIQELIKTAKKDKTGKAMEGLQNATRKWLAERLFNTGKASLENDATKITNADLPASMNQLGKALSEDGTMMKNLRKILTKDEIDTLLLNHRRLENSGRIRQSVVGSGTSVNREDANIAEGAGKAVKGYTNIPIIRNIKSGATLLQNLHYLAKLAVKDARADQIARQIKIQAFLDPEKMKQLLLRPTEQNWKRTAWARQQFNILAQEINRKDDSNTGNEEETPSAPAAPKASAPDKAAGAPSTPRRMRYNPKTGQLESAQ